MAKKEHHISLHIASLLLALILILPSVVKFSHALNHDHEDEVCIVENQTHFHNIEFDCEIYKFKFNNELQFHVFTYDFNNIIPNCSSSNIYYSYLKSHQQLTSHLRGPPSLV